MNPLIEQWRVAADDWSDKANAFDLLDGLKNDFLAKLADAAPGKTHAEKLRAARILPEWEEYQRSVITAKAAMRAAKIHTEEHELIWSDYINTNANARSERKSY